MLCSFLSPFRLCVRCHSIVGLVSCLCDRVVSLWNSGDGVWCVVCGLWFISSLFLPLLLCVGVRGSARAALRARTLSPNTIVFSCCVLFFLVPVFLRAPPFLLLWNGGA
nr:MAG TPA: hypothetical protein [Caudoviricetes sp.]